VSLVEFVSPYSRADCLTRMRERFGSPYTTNNLVKGRMTETGFCIELPIKYRNAFQTRLTAKIADETSGSRVTCRVGLHPFVARLLGFWFIVVASVFVKMLPSGAGAARVPFIMLLGGASIVGLGRFLARDDAGVLIDFVRRALQPNDPSDGD